jgi:hypothetical protein
VIFFLRFNIALSDRADHPDVLFPVFQLMQSPLGNDFCTTYIALSNRAGYPVEYDLLPVLPSAHGLQVRQPDPAHHILSC